LLGFRGVYVFDISQTEGQGLPAFAEVQGDVSGYRERLFKFVETQNIELVYSEQIAPAKGLFHGGRLREAEEARVDEMRRTAKCNFCGRKGVDVADLYVSESEDAFICHHCVVNFYELLEK
jgi:ClpX C4-type zinc finger